MASSSGGAALLRSRQLFRNGKSLGKWVARTRVVPPKHEPMGQWQCVERVLGVATAEGIGFLQYFFSPESDVRTRPDGGAIVSDARTNRSRNEHGIE